MQKERYGADGDVVDTPGQPVRDLPDPQRLVQSHSSNTPRKHYRTLFLNTNHVPVLK